MNTQFCTHTADYTICDQCMGADLLAHRAQLKKQTQRADRFKRVMRQHAEGLRGIVQLIEQGKMDHALQRAKDSLSGYAEPTESATLKLQQQQIADLTAQLVRENELVAHLRIELASLKQERDEMRLRRQETINMAVQLEMDIEQLRATVTHLQSIKTPDSAFTYCAYCGFSVPIDEDGEEIARHIRTCDKHPMRAMELESDVRLTKLRDTVTAQAEEMARLREGLSMDTLVNRFLGWPLPDSVCSDMCATKQGVPHRSGTTLLSAVEAKQMLEHVLDQVLASEKEATLKQVLTAKG